MPKIKLDRRDFIKATAASLFMAGVPISGYTKDRPPGNIAVILLEGGMDGLTAVPPIGDPDLLRMRASMTPTDYLPLNKFFGLHPSLANYAALMARNEATVIHATSFPYIKRSHFEGQNLMEGGGLSPFAEKTGWLGRALELAKLPGRALSLDMPLILRGYNDNDNFFPASIRNSKRPNADLLDMIAMSHKADVGNLFNQVAHKATKNINIPRDATSLAKYAGQEMARSDGPIASVIKVKEFDTHANQVSDNGDDMQGRQAIQLAIVDDVIAAYREGLGDAWKDTIILTLTEFGRTVAANGTRGTEHGYGSAGLLAGGSISSSSVITDWPGLRKRDQFEERDLMATIDYRSVCAACIERSLGLDHDQIASKIFFDPQLPRLYDYIFS